MYISIFLFHRSHLGPRIPLESQPLQRTRHEDDSSSSHSDRNDRSGSARERLRPDLSTMPSKSGRPHSAQVGNHSNQIDTSDSTDTENYGKRRKFKTKHQLDKTKSSSDNFLVDNVQSVNNKESDDTSDSRLIKVLPNDISKETSPRTTNDNLKQYSNSDGAKPHHLSADKLTALSPSVTGNSIQNQSSKSAFNLNASYDSTLSSSHLKTAVTNQNGQMNYLSPDPAGRLSREVSVSSQSSSQSDHAREGDGSAVEKKGHVVYHWAMIQLSMTPEVERFMQDIVSTNLRRELIFIFF